MRDEIRRAVVATAWKKHRGENPSSLYSYETGRNANMNGGYDYDTKAFYTDSYHYGTCTNYSVSLTGTSFTGFDYDTGTSFSGCITGNSIQLYDGGRNFTYTV